MSSRGTGKPMGRGDSRRVLAGIAAGVLAVVGTIAAVVVIRVGGDAVDEKGLAQFYEQPPNAADGAPGTLVRHEGLAGTPAASKAWRIMYRSTDLNGVPIVVTGTVVTPLGPPPPGGRTVLAWGHPTTGTAPECAPSHGFDPFVGIEGLRLLLDRGYTVVATDYAGMGTTGPDSYLVGVTAAHTMLDAVRAATAIPEAEAGTSVVLWGHSQGGQAALFTAEQAGSYAPELSVKAVAVAAPAADLTALMRTHLDDISGVTIGSYAFTAYASVYGDSVPGARIEDVLTPAALGVVPIMNELCLLTNIDELHRIGQPLVGDFTRVDPTTTQPWQGLLEQNSAGGAAFGAPLFVAQGDHDELVVPTDTDGFVAHERGIGIDVTYEKVPDATHATIAYLALPSLMEWLDRVGH
ncbi:alpha/beta fold hydrolase [Rhodococcus gannanensis]|uniref:Alpha/beta fold hydrolase n=1 Tax=Rhodococcus gannanensis TaxID=1960308 RepID=A0ABW4P683_9NOCA